MHILFGIGTQAYATHYFIIQGTVGGPVIKLTIKTKTAIHSAVKVDTIYFDIVLGFRKYN